ncbi:MAG: hypothetical protein WBF42_07000 [Terracidiphilus sp.]
MSVLDALSLFPVLPFAAILALLVYYSLKRTAWKRNRRRGKSLLGFCPSSAALSAVVLFGINFIRPSLAHLAEAVLREEPTDDDEGDPETPQKQLRWQLQKIRRGEAVDRLTLTLPPLAPPAPAAYARPREPTKPPRGM